MKSLGYFGDWTDKAMRVTMKTGFQNKNHWMRAAKRLSALLVATVAIGFTGCGEPGAPGLGTVSVNGGEDVEVTFTYANSGGTCDITDAHWVVPIVVLKDDADLGGVEFGADTVLDLGPLPVVEPVTDALVTVSTSGNDITVLHSATASTNIFTNSALALPTDSGPAYARTGSDGISYLGIIIDVVDGAALVSVPMATTITRQVSIDPASPPGIGIDVNLTFECQ